MGRHRAALLVTEFDDWGLLPDLPAREASPFWHPGDVIARDLHGSDGTAIALAQQANAAAHDPVPTTLEPVSIDWGSSVFHFTTGQAELPSLPARAVLAARLRWATTP